MIMHMLQPMFFYKVLNTPVGKLKIIASDNALHAVLFDKEKGLRALDDIALIQDENHGVLKQTEQQLVAYFAGKSKRFTVPLSPQGSIFQLKAWKELQKIPYGQTISYGEQARRVGDVKKARAVGLANGRNPISIIIPCHRVIGADGSLTGFGGGLKTKEFLLNLERHNA